MNDFAAKAKILFMGTPDFASTVLSALLDAGWPIVGVASQPDRPQGRHRQPMSPPVKRLALSAGIPVLQPNSARDPEFLQACADLEPDLIVTAAYGKILPRRLLDLPRLHALNVHASLLPRLRGAAPIQWAIRLGDKETGVSIMSMVEQMDAGPVWTQARVPIADGAVFGDLHDLLAETGARLLLETLPRILKGELQPAVQDERFATYAPMLARRDECLDFGLPSAGVYNQGRSLFPSPGAYAVVGGRIVKVYALRHDPGLQHGGVPGKIVEIAPDGPVVACRSGAVVATRVQPEGGRIQDGAEFARGRPGLVGSVCEPCPARDPA